MLPQADVLIGLARTCGRSRQSRTVQREMPVCRAIAQSFIPAAISRCTVSNSSIQRTTPFPVVSDEAKLRETADRFEDWSDGTIARHCGRGEIGNRAGFRCPCSKELEGSSPSARTDAVVAFALLDCAFCIC